MKIAYQEGPDSIMMGIAGQFKRGEAKEVNDAIAEALLKKEAIKFQKVEDEPSKKRRDK